MPIFTQSHQVNMDELNSLASYLGVSSGKLVLDAKEKVTACHFDYEALIFNMGNIIKINIQSLKPFSIGSMVNMLKPCWYPIFYIWAHINSNISIYLCFMQVISLTQGKMNCIIMNWFHSWTAKYIKFGLGKTRPCLKNTPYVSDTSIESREWSHCQRSCISR